MSYFYKKFFYPVLAAFMLFMHLPAHSQVVVRVLNQSLGVPPLDHNVNSTQLIASTVYPSNFISQYKTVPSASQYNYIWYNPGSNNVANSIPLPVENGKQYSILLYGPAPVPIFKLIEDKRTPDPAAAKVRHIRLNHNLTNVDIKLNNPAAPPIFPDIAVGNATKYFKVAEGSHTFIMTQAGSNNPISAFQPVTLQRGKVYTLLSHGDGSEAYPATTVLIEDSGTGANKVVMSSGSIPPPQPVSRVTTSPLIDFGQLPKTKTSDHTFEIISSGDVPLTITKISSSNSPVFALKNAPSLPVTLQPGESLSLTVTFKPQQEVKYEEVLDITTNASALITSVELTGEGTGPAAIMDINVERLNFGPVLINETKDTTISITNRGNLDLVIDGIDFESSSPFTFKNLPSLPFTIAPDAKFDLQISFTPTEEEFYNENLTIISNSNNIDGNIIFLEISGDGITKGIVPSITVDKTSIDFNEVEVSSSLKRALVVTAGSGVPLVITGIEITGAGATHFKKDASIILPDTIPAEQSLSMAIEYAPQAEGNHTATLVITSNAGEPVNVTLSGKAVGAVSVYEEPIVIAGTLSVSPNPAAGQLNLQFALKTGQPYVEFILVDALGNTYFNAKETAVIQGSHSKALSLDNIPSGAYTLVLRSPAGQASIPVVVTK
jgi:uncharacterized membrane protein